MSVRRLFDLKRSISPPEPVVEPEIPDEVVEPEPFELVVEPKTLEVIFEFETVSPAEVKGITGVPSGIGPIPFRSETCSSHHFLLACYRYWCNEIREQPAYRRKQWEFVYILQALWERGLLTSGKRGLGFGVGREPLAALMASRGCHVTATDLELDAQVETAWAATSQHAAHLKDLNVRGICEESSFAERVTFTPVNMNSIPSELREFDFCWSACCFEHLGSIEAGLAFYENSLKTLKPGGFAIHTTEFNLSSNSETLDNDATVLFRKKDLDGLMDELRAQGHYCEPLLIHHGSQPVDGFIDMPPYRADVHLRLALANYVTTSVGIITRKASV